MEFDELSFSKNCPIITFLFNCYIYCLAITTAIMIYIDTHKSYPHSAFYVCLLSISYASGKFITHPASKYIWRMLFGKWIKPCLKENVNDKHNKDKYDYLCCQK